MASLLGWLDDRKDDIVNAFDGNDNKAKPPTPPNQKDNRNVAQKAWDQVNPFDSGKSWNNPNQQQNRQQSNPVQDAFNSVTQQTTDYMNRGADAARDSVNAISDTAGNAFDQANQTVDQSMDQVSNGLDTLEDTRRNTVNRAADTVDQATDSVWDTTTDYFEPSSEDTRVRDVVRETPGAAADVAEGVKDIGTEYLFPGVTKFANTTSAAGQGLKDISNIGYQSVFGSNEDVQNAVQEAEKNLQQNLDPNSGLGGQGTFFDGRNDPALQGDMGEFAKTTAGAGLQVSGETVPVGRGVKWASRAAAPLKQKIARAGTEGAVGAGMFSTGRQLAEQGSVDPAQVAIESVAGGTIGGSIPVGAAGAKAGAKAARSAASGAGDVASRAARSMGDLGEDGFISLNPAVRELDDHIKRLEASKQKATSDAEVNRINKAIDKAIEERAKITQGGYVKMPGKNKPESEQLVDDYADILKSMDDDAEGGIILQQEQDYGPPTYTRASEHSKFYRDYHSKFGRPPSKEAWRNEARRQLEKGEAGFGASDDYKALVQKETTPRQPPAVSDEARAPKQQEAMGINDQRAPSQVPVKQRGGSKRPGVDANPIDKVTSRYINQDSQPNDISNYAKGFKDFYRNTRRFAASLGDDFKNTVEKNIIEPLDTAKNANIQMQRTALDDLEKNVVENLGIKPNSKKSRAVQQYGEGNRNYDSLVEEFGQEQADQIVEADKFFRSRYDRFIDLMNEQKKRIYGSNTDKLVPKRDNYYRHFREMNEGIGGLRNVFESPSGVDPDLAGISDFSQPKTKWASIAQRRKGNKTKEDAVRGYLDYLRQASHAINMDPQTARVRKFRQQVADMFPEGDPRRERVSNFSEFLNDFANDMAGKTNPMDRTTQKYIPGGRKGFRAMDWLNRRVKANVILGNAASTMAQTANLPQGLADAGESSAARGLRRSINDIFTNKGAFKDSKFLGERYFNDFDRFDTGVFEKGRNAAGKMIQAGDRVGTHWIWNAQYEKGLKNGMSHGKAVKFADNRTRDAVGGRGVGEVPVAQKSRLGQMIYPFQYEVQNLWHNMGDWRKRGSKAARQGSDEVKEGSFAKKFGAYSVLSFLANGITEQVRGSGVSFDPVRGVLDAAAAYSDADSEENIQEIIKNAEENGEQLTREEAKQKANTSGIAQAVGRLGGEVLSNVVGGQTIASMYDEYGQGFTGQQIEKLTGDTMTREELFGDADPTRFGTGPVAFKAVREPLTSLIPPFGGNQLRKTTEGLGAYAKGFSETDSGEVRFPIDKDPVNAVQSALFGQYATNQARDYFDNERTTLGSNQSREFKALPSQDQQKNFISSIWQNREADQAGASGAGGSDVSKEFAQSSGKYEDFKKAWNLDVQPDQSHDGRFGSLIEANTTSEKINNARALYRGDEQYRDLPQWVKDQYYQEAGVTKDQIGRDIAAEYEVSDKADFLEQELSDVPPNQRSSVIIQEYLKPTISGNHFASYGTLDELSKKGVIPEDEAETLKDLEWNEDKGQFVLDTGSGSGGGGSGGDMPVGNIDTHLSTASGAQVPQTDTYNSGSSRPSAPVYKPPRMGSYSLSDTRIPRAPISVREGIR